jgi:hypothetical protein
MKEFLEKVGAVVVTLNGWCTPEKAQWIARWIVDHRCVSVVDLGVFGGRSLIAMGLAMLQLEKERPGWPGRCIGIDSYSNSDCVEGEESAAGKDYWKGLDLGAVRRNAEDAIEQQGLKMICELMIMTGVHAVERFGDGTLDLVHVDGSHSQAESTRDVKLWWPKVRNGGLMVMDDTNWPTVAAARSMVAGWGKLVHHHEQWEAYQKVPADGSTVEFPPG